MIKTVFFDFDGVLTLDPSGQHTTCKYLSDHTGIPIDKLLEANKLRIGPRNLGTDSYADRWDEFCGHAGKNVDFGLLREAFLSTAKNETMFALVKDLKAHGYKTGIITDNNLERWDLLEKEWKLTELFDSIIVSSKVHLDKFTNGTKIFEKAAESLDINPDETIFIDNGEKNVEMASSLGMHGYYYDEKENDIEALISFLKSLGVKIA
jgi:putative hydrolase of the HAD superfamily